MKSITLDGYEYTLIYRQPTTMNTMCVYKIQKANETPVYFLAADELSERFITRHTFNEIKTHMAPQHYEGFFNDEFTAIIMANNIALDSVVKSQKSALEKAQKSLAEATEKLMELQSVISLENCDTYNQYYDSQDEIRKTAINLEKENK